MTKESFGVNPAPKETAMRTIRQSIGSSYYGPAGDSREKVTVQRHTTTFHLIMTVMTCGLWIPVWMADRRTVTIKRQFRS